MCEEMRRRLVAAEAENAQLWRLLIVEARRGGRWWMPRLSFLPAVALEVIGSRNTWPTFEAARDAIRTALAAAGPGSGSAAVDFRAGNRGGSA